MRAGLLHFPGRRLGSVVLDSLGDKLMKTKYMLSCAVAAVLSGCAGAVFAADPGAMPSGVETVTATDASAGGASSSGPEAGVASTGVEEVIVSAERRDETVEHVPATVQAFTGETLAKLNVETFDEVLKFTPNVTFGNNGPGQGEIFMRGLSAGFRGNQSSGTIANFPNVAIYLDEESMQFPARNADIYLVDMDRVEVLEGPQGTLFGGGAEAGAVRYITNKPNVSAFSASAEATYGNTSHGDPNYAFNFVLNVPLITDKLAVRAAVYDDRHGGYIDNVPSTFTRSNEDLGNFYFNVKPVAGLCPNGQPAGAGGFCALLNAPQANNFSIARKAQNPVTYSGGRVSLLYDIKPDWDVLITESMQDLDAEGLSVQYPVGSDFQPLKPLQVTAFTPSFNKDRWDNTAWTLNGKFGPIKAIYTGSWLSRRISEVYDYANYSRSAGGMYYQCTGGSTGFGHAPPVCFSPVGSWHDEIRSTHISNEVRFSTPDDWRLRALGGAFYEQFRIYDVMNFNYKTIPACNAANLAIALAGGQVCLANVTTAPGATTNDPSIRSDITAFGEDTQRGYDQTALFFSVDYDIIPNVLTVTGGTRWYQYNEFEVGSQYATTTSCLNVPNGQCGGGLVNIDSHHDRVTYSGFKSRGNVTWRITPDVLSYFTFSEGFRPGGFNRSVSNVAPGPNPADLTVKGPAQFRKPNGYAPDSLTNYEIGLKAELLDHRVVANLSAYYMQWNNVQYLFFNPTELGNTTFGVNGPNFEVKGVEFQLIARASDHLTVDASGTYNDDRQTSSPCLVDNIAGTPAFGKCITQVFQTGVGLVPFQNPFGAIGATPPFSPKFEGNIRGRYDWDIGAYKAFVQASVSYTGSMFNQPSTYASGSGVLIPNTTFLRYLQPSYATLDAAIGVSNDKWSIQLYGTNLTDSRASTFTSSAQFIKSEVPLRPRVIAVKVAAHF
ncbi:MAG: TonB-dependent receptor [Caulobacterales bacterium]